MMQFYPTTFYRNIWSPFRPFNHELRLLENMARETEPQEKTAGPTTRRPNYRFDTDENGMRLELEMPGVAKEDVSIRVTGQTLVVEGKRFRRSTESDAGNENPEGDGSGREEKEQQTLPTLVYSLETRFGRMVDLDKVNAESEGNGVFIVKAPKKAEAETRTIEIRA